MTRTDISVRRHGTWRAAIASAVLVSGWLGVGSLAEAQSTFFVIPTEPVSYPAPGREPSIAMEYPTGAAQLSGAEIVAALSDHTALLPGGFVEYYAPDGTLHGLSEDKHYGGRWEVRDGTFCTLLQDSDASVCSPVEREGTTLYWSVDGEKDASAVATVEGNPRNLQ